mgnify:CR=1 FL=1
MPAQHVVDQMLHAITAPLPRNKYYVGPDAYLFASIVWSMGESTAGWFTRSAISVFAKLG